MKEATTNTELTNSLKHFNYFAYKLGDMIKSINSRFIPEKPCDIIACSEVGQMIAIETKLFKKWRGLRKADLRDNQIAALDKVVRNKGRAFLILNIRISANKAKKIQRENWCVIFDWSKHRSQILKNKYTVKVLRDDGLVGEWRTSYNAQIKDPTTGVIQIKKIWDIRDIGTL